MAMIYGPGFFAPGSEGADGDRAARFSGRDGARRIDVGRFADPQARQVIGDALTEAGRDGHRTMHVLHLLRALTRDDETAGLLAAVGAVPAELAEAAARRLPAGGRGPSSPAVSPETGAVLGEALRIARALGAPRLAPPHILFALVTDPATPAGALLAGAGVTPERLQALATGPEETAAAAPGAPTAAPADEAGDGQTPTLDRYGTDLTARAREGLIDPVIGRDDEVEQTVEILMRRRKNNPVLIGEAGVGKTAIAEGLAVRIVDGDVPAALTGTRLVSLDLAGMLAGARYRGEFEERMTTLLAELSAAEGRVLLFIDELHTVVGAGGAEGAVDAGNMLKPKLARGELHVIGATTLDEYRKHIEKDPALERRFQPVRVEEPSAEDTATILAGLRETYQDHHGVRYTDEALTAAVEMSVRYLPDRFLPDKAIDLLDQAGARRRLAAGPVDPAADLAALTADKDAAVAAEDYERAGALRDRIAALESGDAGAGDGAPTEVTAADVAEVVSRATGIPAGRMVEGERARLLRLEDELGARVIGQPDAVSAISRAVRRNRSGMADPARPVGSFLFLGPTGVGKTELAKSLAESLFGDADRMIRVDMSEFGERHTAARLVGAPPGYVGHDEAGQLTERIRRNPYSVVLLDEMEKAHPDVYDLLLQVLDDGRLTDGQGRTVDFSNAVVIMTSNIGSELISARGTGLGFTSGTAQARAESADDLRKRLMGRLREVMRPEFLNRIDEIVVFDRLGEGELHTITDLLLQDSRDRLGAREIGIEIADEVIDWLAQRGHQPEFGARPLRRTIARELDDRLADLLLADDLTAGDTVRVSLGADDTIELTVA